MAVALLGAAACAHPTLRVEPEPQSSQVVIDGVVQGSGPVDRAQPYFGTTAIDVVPPFSADPGAPTWLAEHRDVRFDEPATPWIFPLDLVVEVVTAPWRDDAVIERIAAPRRDQSRTGADDSEALRTRGEALRTQR